MKYYLSDYDWVYGWKDGQMYLWGKGGLKPVIGRYRRWNMKYYLDNQDDVWAIDRNGDEFLVTKDKLVPAKKGSVDIMWGGISESDVKDYVAKMPF